jgi:ABC-2 type transport system ATP-binding protein
MTQQLEQSLDAALPEGRAPLVTVRNLEVKLSGKRILKNLNFDIPSGRVIGLIGHNGAGKTTLSEVLVGLRSFDGEVSVVDQDPRKDRNQLLQKVSYIPDVSILPRWMTVRQLLAYVEGVHTKFVRANAVAFLQAMGIADNAKLGKLSRGMLVQVHLAVIMAIDVPLMILDEPTLGLDITSRRIFYRELIERFCDDSRTVIITTHQITEIETYLSDAIFLANGDVILQDSVEHIQDSFVEIALHPQAQISDLPHAPLYSETRQGQQIVVLWLKQASDSQVDWSVYGNVRVPSLETIYLTAQAAANTTDKV